MHRSRHDFSWRRYDDFAWSSSAARGLLALLATLATPADCDAAVHRAAGEKTWKLSIDGEVQGIEFGDIDADGDRDAVLTSYREDGARIVREVSVFLRAAGGFPSRASARYEVPATVLFVDLADLDQDGQDTILLIDTEGVRELLFARDRLSVGAAIAAVPSPFRATQTTALPFVAIAKDLDWDGWKDLFLPARDGYAFLRARPGGTFDAPHILGEEPRSGVRWGRNAQFRLTTRMARPSPVDWTGDGVGDLMLAFDDQLVLIELQRQGAPKAPRVVVDLPSLLDPGKGADGGLAASQGILRDVDSDGRADLIITQRTANPGLLMGVTTRTFLLLSSDLSGDAPRPRQSIRTDGVTSPPRLFDLDGDGRLDLIITTVPTDLLTRMRGAVFETANVTFFVYRFDPARHRFESEPMFSDQLSVPADRLLDVGAYGWVTFSADYDGDARPDYATYSAATGQVSIRKGEEERSMFATRPITYNPKPMLSLKISLPGPFSGIDIDGDGRAEIVSHGGDHAIVAELGL